MTIRLYRVTLTVRRYETYPGIETRTPSRLVSFRFVDERVANCRGQALNVSVHNRELEPVYSYNYRTRASFATSCDSPLVVAVGDFDDDDRAS